MSGWRTDFENAPKDGTSILLFYRDFLGQEKLVVEGWWGGDVDDPTWESRLGYGDADMWREMVKGPCDG